MKKKSKKFSSIDTLFSYLSPYKRGFIAAIIMIILSTIAMVVAPNIEGMVTNSIISDINNISKGVAGAKIQIDKVIHIIMLLLIIYLLKTVTQMAGMAFLTDSIQDTMKDLRDACIDKVNVLPIKIIDSHPKGDILSRITNDVDTVSNAMQQTFASVLSGTTTIIFAVIMMFRINIVMSLCVLLSVPFSYLVIKGVTKISQKSFDEQQETLGDLSANITESFTGYNEVILFGKQRELTDKFEAINSKLQRTAFKAQFLSNIMSPTLALVTYISIAAITVIGANYCLVGIISVGQLQAFIRFIWQINEPITSVSQLSAQIQSAYSSINRIHEFLNYDEESEPEETDLVIDGSIKFENVVFGYNNSAVLHNISFSADKGSTVAIVGPTGSGKTTIVNLLMRFYDSDNGKIMVDNMDIKDIHRNSLRDNFGMVLQDTWLFAGTIRDNIRFSRPDASDKEVEEACKYANADDFITSLPMGYDTIIDEEANNISQGEKQLLTIARAILKNPKVLILDEATSSIDTKTEKNIQSGMDYLMKDRTSIIIAHRLSTIKSADKILVLKDGNIIETGNHNKLMENDGFYANLYNSQFSK